LCSWWRWGRVEQYCEHVSGFGANSIIEKPYEAFQSLAPGKTVKV